MHLKRVVITGYGAVSPYGRGVATMMDGLFAGTSMVTEKIFPDRFLHVGELNRMGAHPRKEGPTVIVEGVKRLIGAQVMASDLRASAAMVLAGLIAKGTTRVHRAYHIDRGYMRIDERLNALGARVRRVKEELLPGQYVKSREME